MTSFVFFIQTHVTKFLSNSKGVNRRVHVAHIDSVNK